MKFSLTSYGTYAENSLSENPEHQPLYQGPQDNYGFQFCINPHKKRKKERHIDVSRSVTYAYTQKSCTVSHKAGLYIT